MAAQLDLGSFGSAADTRLSLWVAPEVDAMLLLKSLRQEDRQALVEVIAAQMGIAVAGAHVDHAVYDFDQRYIEGAAAQVVHQRSLFSIHSQAERQGCRGRLIQDA